MNLQVKLKKLSIRLARERFLCLKLTESDSTSYINWGKGEDVIVNGKSTKWRDAFVVRETDQNQLLLRNLQAKYDYDSVTFTKKNLIKEYIKNLDRKSVV